MQYEISLVLFCIFINSALAFTLARQIETVPTSNVMNHCKTKHLDSVCNMFQDTVPNAETAVVNAGLGNTMPM